MGVDSRGGEGWHLGENEMNGGVNDRQSFADRNLVE